MAKKAPAKKAPAKRKPRAVKPVEPAVVPIENEVTPESIAWQPWFFGGVKAAALIGCGAVAGIWVSGGIEVGPGPVVRDDVLQQSYAADRISQIAVLRDLAKQPFDGTTDDGRKQAGEWFNAQRFRNRADDFGLFTDAVAESIASNSEDKLAEQLEAK